MVVYLVFISVTLVLAIHYGDTGVQIPPATFARILYSSTAALACTFPVLMGTLTVTTEYRHGTLTPTFLAQPRRHLVLLGKFLTGIPLGFIYGLAALVATVGPAAGLLAIFGEPTGLDNSAIVGTLGRNLLALVLWTLIGVGFGTLLRHQVAAIVALLVFTQFVEPMLRFIQIAAEQDWPWLKFLPGAAGDGLTGGSYMNMLADALEQTSLLGRTSAGLVMLAYALVLTVAGYFVSWRRDVS
jgi:hypothetical protein